jgi:transaldolase
VKIVGVSDDHPRVAACEAAVQKAFGAQVSAARSQPHYLDVTHPTANKGVVVERLSRYLKIPMDRIATLGDQPNDVLMFRKSGLSIAMGNAGEEVKRQATHVTTSFGDEGFANAIEQFILPRAEPARGPAVKATGQLHRLGQSLWLDNITRTMLADGTLAGYIEELSVTGLTSNPTIFDKAISGGEAYDEQIAELSPTVESSEDIFFELAIRDLQGAADLFAGVHDRTDRVDGFVSLEVSPKLADGTEATIAQATQLHDKAERDNLFIKIPGTEAGRPAIEESIFAGIPINVTLLFDDQQYLGAAEAYMRGVERRIEAGLDPNVASVASLFISRWDVAVHDDVPDELKNTLGIAVGKATYAAWREMFESERWRGLAQKGVRLQRLLFASTGTKDPEASDTLYIEAFAAPDTIDTMPDKTLLAFADHGTVGDPLPEDGGDTDEVMRAHRDAGIDTDALALRLQKEGAEAFVKSWTDLLDTIRSESERLAA